MEVANSEIEGDLDRLSPVVKSVSLQEFHSRTSLAGISESIVSSDKMNSSGIYSGSIDISDVCMADLTRLSDSTICSPSGSVYDQAPAASTPGYPMMSLRTAQISTECTPIRSVVELLSPQFGANDEYLHRNIIFIHKQLKSLMLQLATDDKYFQSTVDKYEEIISELNEEIRNLKNASRPSNCDVGDIKIARLENENTPGQLRSVREVNQTEDDCKEIISDELEILAKVKAEMLASFRQSLPTVWTSFSEQKDFPRLHAEPASAENVIQTFKNLHVFLGEITAKNIEANASLSALNERSAEQVKTELDSAKLEQNRALDSLNKQLDVLVRENHALKSALDEIAISKNASVELENSKLSADLSKAKSEIDSLLRRNAVLNEQLASKESDIARISGDLKESESEHKKVVEEFRIKGSTLILENSKLKQELEELHKTLSTAQICADKNTEKFDNLQKLYSELNRRMSTKEVALAEIESDKSKLETDLKRKTHLLDRLCSNFNELLSIFRECHNLGLSQDSSATDIEDGFISLKRRLLDLSQDYITLNNRNKVLEKDVAASSSKLKSREEENDLRKKKFENRCDSLQIALEKLEIENKELVVQKIEHEDSIKRLKDEIRSLEAEYKAGCQDCTLLKDQLRQLKIDLVDRDSAVSTLELHIQSCCEHNRKKALQYKHELHALKRLQSSRSPFASEFSMSPKKRGGFVLKTDVGTQIGEPAVHSLTGGFVERFKVRELEETVARLEKERIVLKRLCKMRLDRIHELEPNSSQSNSSMSSHSSK